MKIKYCHIEALKRIQNKCKISRLGHKIARRLKLPLAFKVDVFNNYGGEWWPRASRWTVLAAGAVLGHGAAEAAFRSAPDWPERFQVQLPATRAGIVRQRQILRAWLSTNRGLFFVELTFLRETPLGV